MNVPGAAPPRAAALGTGAVVGGAPRASLGRVSAILERCPNFHVDRAAHIAELGRQPYTARTFSLRWPERILFGTDAPPDPSWWATCERFLETADESFAYEPGEGPGSQGRWQTTAGTCPTTSCPPSTRATPGGSSLTA